MRKKGGIRYNICQYEKEGFAENIESIFGREWVKLTDYCFQMNESVSSKSNESQVAKSSTLMFQLKPIYSNYVDTICNIE